MSRDPFEQDSKDRPLGDLASRLLRVGSEAVAQTTVKIKERGEEFSPREIVTSAATLTSKGKDELVGLVAREVKNYMEKLELGDEIRALIREHSLEIQASIRVQAIEDKTSDDSQDSKDTPPEDSESLHGKETAPTEELNETAGATKSDPELESTKDSDSEGTV